MAGTLTHRRKLRRNNRNFEKCKNSKKNVYGAKFSVISSVMFFVYVYTAYDDHR